MEMKSLRIKTSSSIDRTVDSYEEILLMDNFITSKHLKYLKRTLESKQEFSHEELYFVPKSYNVDKQRRRRYLSLKQDTNFFKNICCVLSTVEYSKNEDEWLIKLDLKRIPQEVADFVIAYTWMCPCRWFNYDWRKYPQCGIKPWNVSDFEWDAWRLVDTRFKKIAREHLPICTVNNFIEHEIN